MTVSSISFSSLMVLLTSIPRICEGEGAVEDKELVLQVSRWWSRLPIMIIFG